MSAARNVYKAKTMRDNAEAAGIKTSAGFNLVKWNEDHPQVAELLLLVEGLLDG